MRRIALLVLLGALCATPAQAASMRFEKLMFRAEPALTMRSAEHVAHAWARRDVRNGWAASYAVRGCQRLSRVRVRCDVTQYGLEDSYNPRACRGENIDPRADCEKVTDSWPFRLFIAHRHGCVSLWVWDFERFTCWASRQSAIGAAPSSYELPQPQGSRPPRR